MFSWRPTCHARSSRSTTSRRRAWFLILLGGIYTTQEPASIARAVLPPREPEAMPPHGHLGQHTHAGFLRSHRPTGSFHLPVGLNLVPSGARPMRRTSTSPPPPSRISEADFTGTPSETGDLTRVVSGIIGAERLHSWGVWSCTRAGTPLPAPPSRGMRV